MSTWRAAFAFALLATAAPALADSTSCSNPRREGVRGTVSVDLGSGGAQALERHVEAVAERQLGMSVSSVRSEDPDETPVLRQSNLILQSPQVSVAIHIRTSNRNNRARITIHRTCIDDALEPWQPYWRRLLAALRAGGYRPVAIR